MPLKLSDDHDVWGVFELALVPCGIGEAIDDGSEGWRVFALCNPKFIDGQSEPIAMADLPDPELIPKLLRKNPLTRTDGKYEFLFGPQGGGQPIKLSYKRIEKGNVELLTSILKDSYELDAKRSKKTRPKSILEDDHSIGPENYIDALGLYESAIAPARKQVINAQVKQAVFNAENAGSGIQGSASWASIKLQLNVEADAFIAAFPDGYKEQLERYRAFATRSSADDLEIDKNVDGNPSPDEVLAGVMQNSDLGMRLGLVVPFMLTPETTPEARDQKGIVTLTLMGDSTETTAILPGMDQPETISRVCLHRRYPVEGNNLFLVQPWSRYEDRSINLLTRLRNNGSGDNPATLGNPSDYTVKPFNIDDAVIKDLLLPKPERLNNFGGDGTQPSKYPWSTTSKGQHPFSGRGFTLYGPERDLLEDDQENQPVRYGFTKDPSISEDPSAAKVFSKSASIAETKGVEPSDEETRTMTFERLWTGYRLDAAKKSLNEKKNESWIYNSIHSHLVTIMDAKGEVRDTIKRTEDTIYREQRTVQRKPKSSPDGPETGEDIPRVHPALINWDGTGTVQWFPWPGAYKAPRYALPYWKKDYVRDGDNRVSKEFTEVNFGQVVRGRLRNTFQGGISLNTSDASKLMDVLDDDGFYFENEFSRTRPYTPGVLVFEGRDSEQADKGYETRITLNAINDKQALWLYPEPLDRDEAFLSGELRRAFDDNQDLAIVEGQLRKLVAKDGRPRRRPIGYFADPDVTAVEISTWVLGNQWLSDKKDSFVVRSFRDSSAKIRCTDVEPHLVDGESLPARFGDPWKWRLRPIELRFETTDDERPSVEIRHWFGRDVYEFKIPKGDLARLEILPVTNDSMVKYHAFCQETGVMAAANSIKDEKARLDFFAKINRMPGFTTPLHIEVVHETPRPLIRPKFHRLAPRDGDNREPTDIQVYRKSGETKVTLQTSVETVARTTGSIRLVANWDRYEDNPRHPEPKLVSGPSAQTNERSLTFTAAPVMAQELDPNAVGFDPMMSTASETYCVENIVHIKVEGDGETATNNNDAALSTLELNDTRHHIMELSCAGKGRWVPQGTKVADSVIFSDPVRVNVPSSERPPAFEFSHVIALREENLNWGDRTLTSRSRQLIRIYLHRRPENSGAGEMLGIIFDKEWRAQNRRAVRRLTPSITAWGEDPVYRSQSSVSVDNINPLDVERMLAYHQQTANFEDDYPVLFHTELSGDSFNIVRPPSGTDSAQKPMDYRAASIVCVRPKFDTEERLWYVDIDPGDKAMWYRLNTCGVQPHSLPGKHTSSTTRMIEFYSDRQITVAVTQRANVTLVTLDALPYSGTVPKEFLDGHGSDVNSVYRKGRYKLQFKRNAGNDIYVDVDSDLKANANEPRDPGSVRIGDNGNTRFVWKLKAGTGDSIAIKDMLREHFVFALDLETLT